MSITDGSVYCGRCGDDRVSCHLCALEEPFLINRKIKSYAEIRAEELEDRLIERSIRDGAEARRRGEL